MYAGVILFIKYYVQFPSYSSHEYLSWLWLETLILLLLILDYIYLLPDLFYFSNSLDIKWSHFSVTRHFSTYPFIFQPGENNYFWRSDEMQGVYEHIAFPFIRESWLYALILDFSSYTTHIACLTKYFVSRHFLKWGS